MKTKSLFLVFTLFVGTLQILAQITLSHNVDPLTVDVVGLACWNDTTNEYRDNHNARVYNLNEFNITGDFDISAVEFGQAFGDDGKEVHVSIYTSDTEDLAVATLTLVTTTEISLMEANNFSIITVFINASIPAGSIVVVEIFAPDEGSSTTQKYFPGFNFNGETDFSWIKVPFCGASTWRITEEFQTNQQYLINLVGTEVLSVNDNALENVAIYPNPTDGDFTIDLANSFGVVDVTVTNIIGQQIAASTVENTDILNLSIDGESGMYFVTIHTSEGISKTIKVMKISTY